VPGSSEPSGPGERTTYVVEVEGGLGLDPAALAAAVETRLADLASPATTGRLCAPLETGGYFSCATGARAVLNAARWLRGAPSYDGDLAAYRSYVVNHEVGTRGPWPYP
jgi:hypothetical protein